MASRRATEARHSGFSELQRINPLSERASETGGKEQKDAKAHEDSSIL